jgi:hypothetical protein
MNSAQVAALCVCLTNGKPWERILAEVVARAVESYRIAKGGTKP